MYSFEVLLDDTHELHLTEIEFNGLETINYKHRNFKSTRYKLVCNKYIKL